MYLYHKIYNYLDKKTAKINFIKKEPWEMNVLIMRNRLPSSSHTKGPKKALPLTNRIHDLKLRSSI